MLGCSIELLEQCLTKRSVETSKEVVLTPLSDSEAKFVFDIQILFVIAGYVCT